MSAIFVTGSVGIGKSTLLRRVIDACIHAPKIYGFRTEKVSPEGRTGVTGKVFIYPASGPPIRDNEHCVADILSLNTFNSHVEVFETLGVKLLSDIPHGGIVLMDELGFLESKAPRFCEKVLETLSGDCLVLGAVKPTVIPFLDTIRKHPKVTLFEITEQNRDSSAEELIRVFRAGLLLKNRNSGDIRYD